MKLSHAALRSWTYFRVGMGTYIGLIIGYSGNLAVFYLVFTKFYELNILLFSILGTLVIIPIAIFFGRLHFSTKGIQAYYKDLEVNQTRNPYYTKMECLAWAELLESQAALDRDEERSAHLVEVARRYRLAAKGYDARTFQDI